MPQSILVVNKRHFNLFYDVSTQDLRDRAFISLLRYNWESGYINEPVQETYVPEKFKMHRDVTDEEFAALPEAMRKAMSSDRAKSKEYFRSRDERRKQDVLMWEDIQKILACETFKEAAEFRSPNGRWSMAESLSDAPGDNREIIHVQDIGVENPEPMTQILVADQKHGAVIYDASTPEIADRSFCALVRYNWENGFYIEPEEPMYIPDRYKMYEHMTEDDFERLPDVIRESQRREFMTARSWIDSEKHWRNQEIENWNFIKPIVESATLDDAVKIRTPKGTRTAAEMILRNRQGFEYESWVIERVEDVSGDTF